MKKIISAIPLLIPLLFFVSLILINDIKPAKAAGFSYSFTITNSTAPADGQSAVNISALAGDVGSPIAGMPFCLSASGSGNTLSPTTITTGSNGYGYATLKSTVAETKTINFLNCTYGNVIDSRTVTFTTPAPAAATPATSGTSSATSTATAKTNVATPAAATPAAPVVTQPLDASKVQIDHQSLDKAGNSYKTVYGKSIVFSGVTIPKGIINIYVYSTPKKYTVTADAQGKWSLSVNGLPAGNHHAEADITDPATKITSAKTQLLKFAVLPKAASATSKTSSSSPIAYWILAGAIIAGIGIVVFIIIRKRHQKVSQISPETPPSTDNNDLGQTNNQ